MKLSPLSTVLAAVLAVAGSSAFADENTLVISPGPTPFCVANSNEGCSWWYVGQGRLIEDTFIGNSAAFAAENMIDADSRKIFVQEGEYFIRDESA
jgi:hypothetical protein